MKKETRVLTTGRKTEVASSSAGGLCGHCSYHGGIAPNRAFCNDGTRIGDYGDDEKISTISNPAVYDVKTGEIKKGVLKVDNPEEVITNMVNEALGIKTDWKTICLVSFFGENGGSTDPRDLVGKFTYCGTKNTAVADDKLNSEITRAIDATERFRQYTGKPMDIFDYYLIFGTNGGFDLKNLYDNFFGYISKTVKKRRYWAFVYRNELIRYDAPGNILAGYAANHLGIPLWILLSGGFVVGIADSIVSPKKKFRWGDDPGDAYYLKMGYNLYG